jgi:hypothetical protein
MAISAFVFFGWLSIPLYRQVQAIQAAELYMTKVSNVEREKTDAAS